MKSPIRRVLLCWCLCAFAWPLGALAQAPLKTLIAERGVLALEFQLQEWGIGSRTGPLKVFALPPETNPWIGGTFLDPAEFPPLGAALRIDVGSICGQNVFIAGGSTGGWLFGPYLPGDPARALAEIRAMLPNAPAGTAAFVVVVGALMPDGNWAENHLCGGTINPVEFGIQIAFIYPTSTRLASGNYHIGDFYYFSEIGENWYRLLSSTPVGPVTGSAAPAEGAGRLVLGPPGGPGALKSLVERLRSRPATVR